MALDKSICKWLNNNKGMCHLCRDWSSHQALMQWHFQLRLNENRRNSKWINLCSVINISVFYLIWKWSRYLMNIHHLIITVYLQGFKLSKGLWKPLLKTYIIKHSNWCTVSIGCNLPDNPLESCQPLFIELKFILQACESVYVL